MQGKPNSLVDQLRNKLNVYLSRSIQSSLKLWTDFFRAFEENERRNFHSGKHNLSGEGGNSPLNITADSLPSFFSSPHTPCLDDSLHIGVKRRLNHVFPPFSISALSRREPRAQVRVILAGRRDPIVWRFSSKICQGLPHLPAPRDPALKVSTLPRCRVRSSARSLSAIRADRPPQPGARAGELPSPGRRPDPRGPRRRGRRRRCGIPGRVAGIPPAPARGRPRPGPLPPAAGPGRGPRRRLRGAAIPGQAVGGGQRRRAAVRRGGGGPLLPALVGAPLPPLPPPPGRSPHVPAS